MVIFAILLVVGAIIWLVWWTVRSESDKNSKDTYDNNIDGSLNDNYNYHQSNEYIEYQNIQDAYSEPMNAYQNYQEEIGMLYTTAINTDVFNDAANKCIELCLSAISLATAVKEYYIEMNRIGWFDMKDSKGDVKLPVFEPYKRLCMLYEKRKEYDKALDVCEDAISMGFIRDGTQGGMIGRAARINKKREKEIQQQ